MTKQYLNAIDRWAEAATPGPWTYRLRPKHGIGVEGIFATDSNGLPYGLDIVTGKNGIFCAHARTDVPALVVEVRRLAALMDALR